MFPKKDTEPRRGSLTALLHPHVLSHVPLPFTPDDPLRADHALSFQADLRAAFVYDCRYGVIAHESL
jgi:hypothetical protein